MHYWYCPHPGAPSGGVWLIHRLAALANSAEIPSQVVQAQPFDVWWDAHPIDKLLIWPAGPDPVPMLWDVIITPEVVWPLKAPGAFRQIMFLQNYIWLGEDKRDLARETKPDILVCSRYLFNWCKRELGVTPIGIVNPYLDEDTWKVEPKTANRVMLYARRGSDMAGSLAAAIVNAGFGLDLIREPLSQRDIANHFNLAEFYVHHVEPEGFPMAALEAMRSGTIVVGSTGGGGNEFMFEGETALTTAGPLLGQYPDPGLFVDDVMKNLARLREDAALRHKLWRQAHTWSLQYTAEASSRQLIACLKSQ